MSCAPRLLASAFVCLSAFPAVSQQVAPAIGGQPSQAPFLAMSDDGRILAFRYDTGGLIPGDSSIQDVFVRDIAHGTYTRLTDDTFAVYTDVHVSGNGNVVGYSKMPSNGQELARDTFVYDRTTLARVELAPTLHEVSLHGLSADGRYAVVAARSQNSGTSPFQVLRVDANNGNIVLCSRDAGGNPVFNEFSQQNIHAGISADGSRVVFASSGTTLVPGDTNGVGDVFVYDVPSNTTTRVSVSTSGAQGTSSSRWPSISANGRNVAFETTSALAAGDSNLQWDVCVRDLQLGTTTRASIPGTPFEANDGSIAGQISPDGRRVAFMTAHQPTPTTLTYLFHVRDLDLGVTLSVDDVGGQPPARREPIELSFDGRRVLVMTVPHGPQIVDYGPPCSVTNYCSALPNSTGQAATLTVQGHASALWNDLVIAAANMPSATITLLFSGTTAIDPGTPFGNGLRCVGGALVRHSIQQASSGAIAVPQNVVSAQYANVHPGDRRCYQVYYRDPSAGGAWFNTTSAAAVTFCW